MSKAPDRTIREITAELYERFGCAEAPMARTARLLQQIDLAADTLVAERDEALEQARLASIDCAMAEAEVNDR